MKRKLLFLSFYFHPDLCAGSFRATSIVDAFSVYAGMNWEIDVFTTMPNRYHSFSPETISIENNGPVTVNRISLPRHQSGMHDQSFAFISFAKQVKKAIKGRIYDAVFATSSRLATGVLAAWIANGYGAPFYLDIRDIFADTLNDVLNGSPLKLVLPAVKMAERYTLESAGAVNLVSAGFLPYFQERYQKRKYSTFSNGIDDEFLNYDFFKKNAPFAVKTILYAGNIGDGQGLHRIVPSLATALGNDWLIKIVGDGGRKRELETELVNSGATNVELLPPEPRSKLMSLYKQADVLFLHLNDHKAFKRVLPSKIFEYAATGKPVLAGVGGFSASFIRSNITNAAVFQPCNAHAGVSCLNKLKLEHSTREVFMSRYTRRSIVRKMVNDMLLVFNRDR